MMKKLPKFAHSPQTWGPKKQKANGRYKTKWSTVGMTNILCIIFMKFIMMPEAFYL